MVFRSYTFDVNLQVYWHKPEKGLCACLQFSAGKSGAFLFGKIQIFVLPCESLYGRAVVPTAAIMPCFCPCRGRSKAEKRMLYAVWRLQ